MRDTTFFSFRFLQTSLLCRLVFQTYAEKRYPYLAIGAMKQERWIRGSVGAAWPINLDHLSLLSESRRDKTIVHASKTELIVCCERQQLSQIEMMPEMYFMAELLSPSPHVKNLGVIMDQNLSWHQHLKFVSQRCFDTLVGLAHARHVLSLDVLPRLMMR